MAIGATKSVAGGALEMPRKCREMTSQSGKDAGHTVRSSQHPVSKSAILSGQLCDFVTSPEQTGLRSGLVQNAKSRPVLSSVRLNGESHRHRAMPEIPGGSACKKVSGRVEPTLSCSGLSDFLETRRVRIKRLAIADTRGERPTTADSVR